MNHIIAQYFRQTDNKKERPKKGLSCWNALRIGRKRACLDVYGFSL